MNARLPQTLLFNIRIFVNSKSCFKKTKAYVFLCMMHHLCCTRIRRICQEQHMHCLDCSLFLGIHQYLQTFKKRESILFTFVDIMVTKQLKVLLKVFFINE